MPAIPVVPYPLLHTYGSFGAAIRGATAHPLRPRAEADGQRLMGATVADAYWTDAEHVVGFSNGLYLHVRAEDGRVEWEVSGTTPVLTGHVGRIGDPPLLLGWGPRVGDAEMDRSSLAAKRLGAAVTLLAPCDEGLLLYCRRHLIWWFDAVRRTDLNRPMLFVSEDE